MSFERTLLKDLRQDKKVEDTEFVAETNVQVKQKRKTFRVTILPLLALFVLLLLFVTLYALYVMLTEEIRSVTKDKRNINSRLSFPDCGRRYCEESNCKVRSRRLVGGKITKHGAWPWMAGILVDNKHACAGTLINKNYIVTAAHCLQMNGKPISEKRLSVVLGLNHRTKPESSTQHFSVCNFVMHDLFNRETLENDIAIVKIKKNAMLDDFVWPACLSSKGVSTHFTDKYGYMIGWGKEKVSGLLSPSLKAVKVPVVSHSTCSKQNDKVYRTVKVNKHFHTCAGYGRRRIEYACEGDSGGGFLQKHDSAWYVTGIISWVDPICNSSTRDTYTVLTRISHYETWLASNMDLPKTES